MIVECVHSCGVRSNYYIFFPPLYTLKLRERIDAGVDVELTEDTNPHDVACILKEFFRSLPEPLLTRELYYPFLSTTSEPLEREGTGFGAV